MIFIYPVFVLVSGQQIMTPFLAKLLFVELKVFQGAMEYRPVDFIDVNIVKFVDAFHVLPVV